MRVEEYVPTEMIIAYLHAGLSFLGCFFAYGDFLTIGFILSHLKTEILDWMRNTAE